MLNNVVSVPVPAISGKARGTIEIVEGTSSRCNFIPKIISKEIKNKTKDPAIAKSEMATPNKSKIDVPKKETQP